MVVQQQAGILRERYFERICTTASATLSGACFKSLETAMPSTRTRTELLRASGKTLNRSQAITPL